LEIRRITAAWFRMFNASTVIIPQVEYITDVVNTRAIISMSKPGIFIVYSGFIASRVFQTIRHSGNNHDG
jgi:hypothetical protein